MKWFISLLVLLSVITLIFFFKRKDKSATNKGIIGEKRVAQTLAKLPHADYIVLNDCYIPTNTGKTVQIDHLVFGPQGMIVIETKNYSGWIFGNENSQNWTQVLYKRKELFYNPIWQNYGHVQALKSYIGANLQQQIPFHSFIVFGNQATLKFTTSFKKARVVNQHELLQTILALEPNSVIEPTNMSLIKNKLSLLNMDEKQKKKIAQAHINQVQSHIHNQQQQVHQNICPRCGAPLVIRHGKNGNFKGCNSFPKCRYTA